MHNDSPRLLVVDDDPVIRTFLADNLTADGYELLVADSVATGLRCLECDRPDLAVIDVGLPDGSGLELLRTLRGADGIASRIDPDLPVVVLTGCASDLDRVRGFERGADDYVTKPFVYGELRLRIAAVLNRSRSRLNRGRIQVGQIEIDPGARMVTVCGQPVQLAAKEFALLRTLAAAPTRVFTKEELLRDVWGFRARGATRTLDSHACRLRQKLRTHGDDYVINVWGVGYRLVDGPF